MGSILTLPKNTVFDVYFADGHQVYEIRTFNGMAYASDVTGCVFK